MKFLNYDSRFMTGFRRIVDYVCLGLLWILASVPIFTFGAATTAMLRTAEFSICKEEGKIFIPFWKYFRSEFKQATILWIIELPIAAILILNLLLVSQDQIHPVFRGAVGVASAIIFCWIQLWFGYQSKFKDDIKTVLINTFRLTLGNLGKSFLMGVLAVIALAGGYLTFILIPPFLLLVPGIYIMAYTASFRRLIKKYIPQEASSSEEITE